MGSGISICKGGGGNHAMITTEPRPVMVSVPLPNTGLVILTSYLSRIFSNNNNSVRFFI
jgi:hypothetical protein